MGLDTKKCMATGNQILKRPFLNHLVIFKNCVTLFKLSTCLLIQGQIFTDSYRHCRMRESGEDGNFWCKQGIGQILLP